MFGLEFQVDVHFVNRPTWEELEQNVKLTTYHICTSLNF